MSSVYESGSSNESQAIVLSEAPGGLVWARLADTARARQARPVCAVGISPVLVVACDSHTHTNTRPASPQLVPFTLTHLDGRDRGGGSDGNLGASRRGGTTELCE
jgi:hypothetical protein